MWCSFLWRRKKDVRRQGGPKRKRSTFFLVRRYRRRFKSGCAALPWYSVNNEHDMQILLVRLRTCNSEAKKARSGLECIMGVAFCPLPSPLIHTKAQHLHPIMHALPCTALPCTVVVVRSQTGIGLLSTIASSRLHWGPHRIWNHDSSHRKSVTQHANFVTVKHKWQNTSALIHHVTCRIGRARWGGGAHRWCPWNILWSGGVFCVQPAWPSRVSCSTIASVPLYSTCSFSLCSKSSGDGCFNPARKTSEKLRIHGWGKELFFTNLLHLFTAITLWKTR